MLRLAGTTDLPPSPSIELVYGFSIWWNELREVHPKSWWTIRSPGHLLLVEVQTSTGTVTSIECPLLGTVQGHSSPLWTETDVTEGHPVFEPTLPPWEKSLEPHIETFGFDYSPSEVKLQWGTTVRALRSGRCLFGLNEADDLVSVGLMDMSDAEFGKLRLGVGEGRCDLPVSQFPDWQLAATRDMLREQLDAPWHPGPKAKDPTFIAMSSYVQEIEGEIERRRASR